MEISNFIKKFLRIKSNPALTKIGLEEALEKGLIKEEEYHYLKIKRHEEALRKIMKEELRKK